MPTELQQAIDRIAKAESILITGKRTYSGDSLGSAVALAHALHAAGKTVTLAIDGFEPSRTYEYLPLHLVSPQLEATRRFVISLQAPASQVQEVSYDAHDDRLDFFITPAANAQFSHEQVYMHTQGADFDLIITTGTSRLESLGAIYDDNTELFFKTPIINIDHRPHNEEFGQINCVVITALATCEIAYELLQAINPQLIDETVATALLTGLIAQSNSFKVGSLTPNSLRIASELVERGAARETIVKYLYQNRKLNTLKLWGRVLAKLKSADNDKLLWSALNAVDFDKTGASAEHIDDVIDELVTSVPQAEIVVLFVSTDNTATHVTVHTTKTVNATSLVKEYGATGDKDRASFTLAQSAEQSESVVIAHIQERLRRLPV